jgi:F-type H+-transporting ATPase subunit gamma
MATLKELRGRIKSAKNIQQITKAMKMVAAARLRRSQERMLAARPYADKIAAVIADIAPGASAGQPLLEMRPGAVSGTGALHLVIIAADRGLCGSFNVNVLRRATQIIREQQAKRVIKVTLIGRKARDFFKNSKLGSVATHVNIWQDLKSAFAELLSEELQQSFLSGNADEVQLIYTRFVSTLTLKVEEPRLLPFAMQAPEAGEPKPSQFEFEPAREEILSKLLPRAVTTAVWRALLESQASEFAAKMTAMDSATRNSKEMINNLTLKANRIRQAVITKEIAELVGGAEALK